MEQGVGGIEAGGRPRAAADVTFRVYRVHKGAVEESLFIVAPSREDAETEGRSEMVARALGVKGIKRAQQGVVIAVEIPAASSPRPLAEGAPIAPGHVELRDYKHRRLTARRSFVCNDCDGMGCTRCFSTGEAVGHLLRAAYKLIRKTTN